MSTGDNHRPDGAPSAAGIDPEKLDDRVTRVLDVLSGGEALVTREIAERAGIASTDISFILYMMLRSRQLIKAVPRGFIAPQFAERHTTVPDPRDLAPRLLPLFADMEHHTLDEIAAFVEMMADQVAPTLRWLCNLHRGDHCHIQRLADGSYKARTSNRCDLHGKQNCCWGVIPKRLRYPSIGFAPSA
jgi:hypothetical protein